MIEVRNLTKMYGETHAVRDISFTVGKGEILGFLGPNGAGKSTTMRILTCFTPATSGTAKVAGHDVLRESIQVRRQIGYLPETVPLYPEMTVTGYLRFMAEAKGHFGGKGRAAVGDAIAECGLREVSQRLIGHLSRGFRQRVGLAQAVLGNPSVLILDEPTIGLDPRQIVEIRQMIKDMAGRRTVILSTHILPEVSLTCQKVLIIHRGQLVASGTPEQMVSDLAGKSEVVVVVSGESEAIEKALRAVSGVKKAVRSRALEGSNVNEFSVEFDSAKDPAPALARAIVEAGHQLREMRTRGLTLEDVFIRIISEEEKRHVA